MIVQGLAKPAPDNETAPKAVTGNIAIPWGRPLLQATALGLIELDCNEQRISAHGEKHAPWIEPGLI